MAYLEHLLITISLFTLLVVSLNLVVGYTGLLSVAHAGFSGVGAYVFTILLVHHGWGFLSALCIAIVLTGLLAFSIGFILSRLRNDSFALGTLGLNAILTGFMLNLNSVTGGSLGMARIPSPRIGSWLVDTIPQFLLFVIGIAAFVFLVCFWITRSAFGLVLKAIREDEDMIRLFGYHVRSYKLIIFVISAALAGVCGALYASYARFIDPTSFTITVSIDILVAAILGGLGRLRGSIMGAFVFIGVGEAVRFLGFTPDAAAQWRLALVGLMIILLTILRPQGIFGTYRLR